MAALVGVNVDRTISLTFVMGAALAAVAGTMYLMYYGVVNFTDGFTPGVKAFTAAVLGGIGSLPGAVLGGILIGLIEALWSAYFSIDYKDVAVLLDPRHRADLHAVGPARPTGSREGLIMANVNELESAEDDSPSARRSKTKRELPLPRASPPAPRRAARRCSRAALKEAFFAGIIATAMFGPLIGIETTQNIDNQLVYSTRWPLLFTIVGDRHRRALPAGALHAGPGSRRSRRPAAPRRAPGAIAFRARLARYVRADRRCVFLFTYPVHRPSSSASRARSSGSTISASRS